MPLAVLRSASRRRTITRSCKGRIFIGLLLYGFGQRGPFRPARRVLRTIHLGGAVSTHRQRVLMIGTPVPGFKSRNDAEHPSGPPALSTVIEFRTVSHSVLNGPPAGPPATPVVTTRPLPPPPPTPGSPSPRAG